MQGSVWFYVICAIWAVAVVGALIRATRFTYMVEARSGRRPLRSGLPGFANVIPVALNIGVARDAETQGLRREVVKRLLMILGGFVAFALFLAVAGQGAAEAGLWPQARSTA